MKAIILSVNPPHAGNLVDGLKTIEWRTKPLPECKAYIYETKKNGGSGLIIGEVVIGENAKCNTNRLDRVSDFVKAGKVSSDYIREYAKAHNTDVIYANMVWQEKRYEEPKKITEFKRLNRTEENAPCAHTKWLYGDCASCKECNLTRPPQSWQFVEEL